MSKGSKVRPSSVSREEWERPSSLSPMTAEDDVVKPRHVRVKPEEIAARLRGEVEPLSDAQRFAIVNAMTDSWADAIGLFKEAAIPSECEVAAELAMRHYMGTLCRLLKPLGIHDL